MAEATIPSPTAPEALQAEVKEEGGLSTFRSLRHRDYRLLWFGTLFSSSGQWIQQVTIGWLAYQLTGSAFLLGAVNGFRSLPLLVLGPFGGVAADRADRKSLMLVTQVGIMVLSGALAAVILTGQVRVWHLFLFTFLTGVAWAFNMPVRQSVVPNLVPRDDLMNALALNSAGFNLTRIVGPAIAGTFIAKFGAGENFLLQAAAYAGVAFMVARITVPDVARSTETSVVKNMKEGANFVWTHPTLRTQMTLALVPVVIALPYSTLMPIVARDVLHRGPVGFGALMSAPGVGAVIGTLTIATLKGIQQKGRFLLGAVFSLGVSLIVFSLSRSFVVSLLLLVVIGACQMAYMTTNQTLLQLTAPDELRGRVMGIYMLNQGLLPLGSLFAGSMAGAFGAPAAIMVMGTIVSAMAVLFAFRAPSLRTV